MTGLLHIHIGPPKTGSTSVQLALQSVDLPRFQYLGARQPREQDGSGFSSLLHAYCSGITDNISCNLKKQILDMQAKIADGETVVLSEEMFLVWQDQAHFWTKLERLDKVFRGIARRYVVTLRDPKDALPSYYQELWSGLSAQEKLNPTLFFNHCRCDCYDYASLAAWFVERNIPFRTLDFDSLKTGNLSLRQFLGPESPFDHEIPLPKANQSLKGKAEVSRILQSVTLADFSRKGRLQWIKERVRQRVPGAFLFLKRWANRIVVRPSGERKLLIPEDRLAQLAASYQTTRARLLEGPGGKGT